MTETPDIQVPTPDVTENDCDIRLGAYMRAWNQVEMALFELFSKLIDTHHLTAHVIFHNVAQQTLREIILNLGQLRLSDRDWKRMDALMTSTKKTATKRNRIVHGTWRLEISIFRDKSGKETNRTATWTHFYQPSDIATFAEIDGPARNQKTRSSHRFTLADVEENGRLCRRLADQIREFSGVTTFRNPEMPKPLKF